MYLLNAFSLQMVDTPCVCKFSEVEKLPEGLESAVGHPGTAAVLGVTMNHINVKLNRGDIAYIASFRVEDFLRVLQLFQKVLASNTSALM